jgi:hypothetical protein
MSIFPSSYPPEPPSTPPTPPAPPPAPPPYQGAPPPQYPPQQQYAPPPYYPPPPPPPAESNWKIPALFVAVILSLGANGYLYNKLDHVQKAVATNGDTTTARLDKLEELSSLTTRSNQKKVEELRDQLERSRRQANLAVGQAKEEALKKVDETRTQLEAAQQESQKQLKSDISQVRDSADSANTKISQVGTEVSSVKTDVASTRSELEKTVADLKHATGEIDGHSVLIATNGKELSALKALNDRTYVEFTLQRKAKQPQKVGDVLLLLKNCDPKKNRFTIELTADDKTVEKKDRVVNEPLQFMTSKAKQPYELVVNDVKKETIAGYLSIPKVLNVRN